MAESDPLPHRRCCWSTWARRMRPPPRAVRRYLAEFLHDYRVVELTRWLWCPILHGIILPLRGARVARNYAAVWMPGGSPLAVHTRAWPQPCSAACPTGGCACDALRQSVAWRTVLRALREAGARRGAGAAAVSAVLDHDHRLGRRRDRHAGARPARARMHRTTTTSIAGWVGRDGRVDPRALGRARARRAPAVLVPRHAAAAGRCAAIRTRAQCEASAAAIADALGLATASGPADLPVALRPRTLAAAVHRKTSSKRWASRACARSTWSARVSRWTAWKRWRKSRWRTPNAFARARRRAALHPVPQRTAARTSRRWRRWRSANWPAW